MAIMLTKKKTENQLLILKGIVPDDQIFLDCLCEMMENVQTQLEFTNDPNSEVLLAKHSRVIRKVLEQNLKLY